MEKIELKAGNRYIVEDRYTGMNLRKIEIKEITQKSILYNDLDSGGRNIRVNLDHLDFIPIEDLGNSFTDMIQDVIKPYGWGISGGKL